MRKILPETFFNRNTTIVAKELLGKFLIRKIDSQEISAMIIETEAYDGPHDKASHAFKGKTPRTEVMFGHPGIFYVYLCYGVHVMLNVVTREHGYPSAVLIRGVVISKTKEILNGPGKVTKFLHIDKKLHFQKAKKSSGLWFEDRGVTVTDRDIRKSARIGVSYAGPLWSVKKLRFFITQTKNLLKTT